MPRQRVFRPRSRPQVVRPIVVPVAAGFTRTAGYFGRYGLDGELKFNDEVLNSTTIAAGTAIFDGSMNGIGQGTSETQRIGRKCTIRQINFRYTLTLNLLTDSAVPTNDVVRIMVYLDKQANGAIATNTDILDGVTVHSFNKLSNKSRFRTLMDRTYSLKVNGASGADATAEWVGDMITDSWFKKVNIPIEFDSTTGAITEVRSNNIGILVGSLSGRCNIIGNMRLRFSDA